MQEAGHHAWSVCRERLQAAAGAQRSPRNFRLAVGADSRPQWNKKERQGDLDPEMPPRGLKRLLILPGRARWALEAHPLEDISIKALR